MRWFTHTALVLLQKAGMSSTTLRYHAPFDAIRSVIRDLHPLT